MGLTTNTAKTLFVGIVIFLVVMTAYVELIPVEMDAGDSLGDGVRCTASGGYYNSSQSACYVNQSQEGLGVLQVYDPIPLGNLFNGTGFITIILMVALLLLGFKLMKKE